MADLAEVQDIIDRWGPLTADQQAKAAVRITDASAFLRSVVADIETRMVDNDDLTRLVAQRVADAVYRSLPGVTTSVPGAASVQETIGSRSYMVTYRAPGEYETSGVYFTEAELAPLRPGGAEPGPTIGTAQVRAAHGWAPPRHRSDRLGARPWWPR